MVEYYVVWIFSIILTYCMQIKFGLNFNKDLADRGYKFNLDKKINIYENVNLVNNKYNQFLNHIIPFIPVINILYMFKLAVDYSNNREYLIEQLRVLGAIEIMDDLEQQEYEKKETGLNAFLAPKKVEMRLEDALVLNVEINGKEGEIFYEVDDNCIIVLKATGSALKFTKKEQEDLIYQTLEIIYINGLNMCNNQSFMDATDYDTSLKLEKEELKLLKDDLLDAENNEKGKSYVKRKK